MVERDEYGRPASLPNGFKPWPVTPTEERDEWSVVRLYNQGFAGAFRDPDADEEFLSGLQYKTFGDAASANPGLSGSGEGKTALLYRYVIALSKQHGLPLPYVVAQKRGDCVSFSTRNASDALRATEIALKGEPEAWINETATETIYWYRGHSGEGASCSRLAEWLTKSGGMMIRQKYPDLRLDLTSYDPSLGVDGTRGPPANVRAIASEHPVKYATLITSVEQARDALANGYPMSVCSGFSFSDKRSKDGIAARTPGGWAHAMAWLAVDDSPEARALGGPLFYVQNSWGLRWNSGGWPTRYGENPGGGFWIVAKDAAGMIASGGSYAFSDAHGFKPKTLPHLGATGRI
jgi:hypothetical protein